MSGSIGDNFGSSPAPTTTQQETTAFVQNSKNSLGLVADSLEMAFTQLGTDGLWKYQSGSSRPSLAPFITIRTGIERKDEEEGIWKQYFEGVKKALPPEIRAKLEANAERAREDRDTSLVALGDVLKGVASFLATAELAGMLSANAEARSENNLNLSSNALESFRTEGKNFVEGARKLLNVISPSDYDTINGILNDLGGIIEGLGKVPQENKVKR